jgi:amino acid adenylation domain-containing protein
LQLEAMASHDASDRHTHESRHTLLRHIGREAAVIGNNPGGAAANSSVAAIMPDMAGKGFSCFLIGSGSLLIRCAELLLQKGCAVCGIISADRRNRDWAARHGIPCFGPEAGLTEVLGEHPFDFLFSVGNIRVFTPDILSIPKRAAINYHDSPLPRYAGVHATAWAIMNRETRHAVSWHIVEEGIDTGDILKQHPLEIARNETSLSLNTKCYEAASIAFDELVDELKLGRETRMAQDPGRRTYYPLYQRPPCGGVIFFNQPAAAIDALVRALTFGEAYPNPLVAPKIMVRDTFFIVERLVELESGSNAAPGTVVGIGEDAVTVATASNDVAIRRIRSIDGEPLSPGDLAARYDLARGDLLAAPAVPVANRLTEGVGKACRHERYWVERLIDAQPLQIPYIRSSAVDCSGEPEMAGFEVPEAFLSYANSAALDPVHAVVSAFVAYLARISHADRFDVGYIRPAGGLDWPAGFFAPVVPLRVDPDFSVSFPEFGAALQQGMDRIGDQGTYARDVRYRYPEFNNPVDGRRSIGLPAAIGRVETLAGNQGARFAGLSLVYVESETRFSLVYLPQAIGRNDVHAMAAQFRTLLQGIAADPQARLSELPLLTAQERLQILVEWNATAHDYPQDLCMHRLFEAQAARTPDAVALLHGDQQLGYAELDARANRLARHLRGLGVVEESLVAICVERSLEMVVGMLGVMKAGAAYVPLDPAYPAQRLAFMLSDSAAGVVLTQARLLERLPPSAAVRVCLDDDWPQILRQPPHAPATAVTPRNLAYVIYTSGSTGQPKGVAIEHRSIADRCLALHQHYQLSAADRVFQSASLSFDVSVDQILTPLSRGAAVVLGRSQLGEPAEFDADIRRYGVTVVGIPPAFFQQWVRMYSADSPPPQTLQLIVVGGDVLAREPVLAWQALPHAAARLVNAYGPTEATVWATHYPVPRPPDSGSIPIGRPLIHTRVHVLDEQQRPVPAGVAGELYIGGIGVARGYLNRPELTAQRFIADPFGAGAGERLYRSGDLARYRADGNLEFLGRIDQQIKLRGFRIEPGEIEAVLRQFPAVSDAAVLAREDQPGDQRLVAYVVALPGAGPTPAALREFALRELPDYMVPAAYVMLGSLPLTPNGKLDRKALPAPTEENLSRTQGYVAPGNAVEQALCGLWSELLEVERIGIHDDFFELGGHSLLVTQLVSAINQSFCISMPMRSVFDHPTVAAQGREVERMQLDAMPDGQQLEQLLRETLPQGERIPLSFAQQGFWLADQFEPGNSAHNIAHEIVLTGALDVQVLERSLNEIVRRHDVLRTTFTRHGDEVVQSIAPAHPFALKVVDLAGLAPALREQELRRSIILDSDTGFDLQHGPLLRLTLFRLSAQQHVLLMVVHHIVFDGWSTGIFSRELETLYGAYRNGLPASLPALPGQYAGYAVWERQRLQGEELDQLLGYWKQRLAGALRLKLPADRPHPARPDHRVAREELQLAANLSAALKRLAQQESCTLFMLLTAAFKLLLHRLTGQEDIVVGAPIAGRRNIDDFRDSIGAFINTIVLRTDLSGNPAFGELLQREREVAFGAYRHSGLPFDKLVEELRPERKAGLNPYIDVLVNYWDESWAQLKLDGLDECRVRNVEQQSSFALSLGITEGAYGLGLDLRYQAALFSAGHIHNLLDQFRYLLEQVSSAPQLPISSCSLRTPATRSMLPDPAIPLPEPQVRLVPDCFSAWAASAPQQIAIRQGGQAWTFQALSACSRAQAQQLLALGMQRGDVVALSGPRSFGLISAMLAVFISGGVVLAIDRNLPPARQRLMLGEARAKFLIRAVDGLPDSGSLDPLPQLQVEADSGEVLAAPAGCSDAGVALPCLGGDDPAYVFFTSGSTGVPKGILGTHKGMAHMIGWQRAAFSITPQDRCAQLVNLSFDAVLRDIFLPLTSGATLCLPQEDEAEGARLLQWLAREQITLLHTVPSLAQSWLEDAPPDLLLPAMRWMFFSGESLNGALVRRWQKRCTGGCGFVNLYGPTETTLIKTYYIVPEDVVQGPQPLGRALPDTQILILGEQDKPCGLGEPGEIVIRTPFSTLGYLDGADGNRRGFAGNPFRDDAHDRVYYTGDRGYYGADGLLYMLGRLDHQVKINGVRIEPDEVTAVLATSETVASCIVVGSKDAAGQDMLVAYLVPRRAGDAAAAARAYLAERLPFAMVPRAYVQMEQLPLKPNGKVDRGRLPAWGGEDGLSKEVPAAPATATEVLLAGIWKDILKLGTVGMHDDFFALGGHSLSGMQLMARIHHSFSIQLPLHQLFEFSTIADQGREIDRLQQVALSQEGDLERLLCEAELLQSDEQWS